MASIGCYVVWSFTWQSDGIYRLLRCFVFQMAVRWALLVVTFLCHYNGSQMRHICCYFVWSFRWQSDGIYRLLRCIVSSDDSQMTPIGCYVALSFKWQSDWTDMLLRCLILSFRWQSDGTYRFLCSLSFRWQSDGPYWLLRFFVILMAVRWDIYVVTLFGHSDGSQMASIGC